jgi:hypothetical protein
MTVILNDPFQVSITFGEFVAKPFEIIRVEAPDHFFLN